MYAAWSPRYWHSVVVHEDALYLLAGLNGRDNQNLNDVWKTVDGKTWLPVRSQSYVHPAPLPDCVLARQAHTRCRRHGHAGAERCVAPATTADAAKAAPASTQLTAAAEFGQRSGA